MDDLVERLYREAPLLDSMAKNVADALRSLGQTPLEGTEQVGDILRLSAARIQALETSLAEAEGRVIAEVVAWLRAKVVKQWGEDAADTYLNEFAATALETGEWKK